MSSTKLKLAIDSPWLYVGVVLIGSLSFVTALALNDLIQAIFIQLLGKDNTILAYLIYSSILLASLIGLAFLLAILSPKLLKNS